MARSSKIKVFVMYSKNNPAGFKIVEEGWSRSNESSIFIELLLKVADI